MAEELITLYSPGSLPGIPGDHAPGSYLVDYEARTIRPAQENTSEPIQQEEVQPPEPLTEPVPPQEEAMPDVVPVPDLQETPAQESNQ